MARDGREAFVFDLRQRRYTYTPTPRRYSSTTSPPAQRTHERERGKQNRLVLDGVHSFWTLILDFAVLFHDVYLLCFTLLRFVDSVGSTWLGS